MAKFDKLKRSILNKVGGSLTPVIIKHIAKMIGDDLNMPPEQRIWSGPNKSIDKVFEEVLELANSSTFKTDLKNKIRMVTLGLAFAIDLDEMIEDALRDKQTMEILHELVTNILENSKYNRILENPSSDKVTKLKDLEPILKSQIDQIIHKLKNDCYDPSMRPDPAVCGSTKNFLKEKQNKKAMNEKLLSMKVTQLKLPNGTPVTREQIAEEIGMNLSGMSLNNIQKLINQQGGKRKTIRKNKRRSRRVKKKSRRSSK